MSIPSDQSTAPDFIGQNIVDSYDAIAAFLRDSAEALDITVMQASMVYQVAAIESLADSIHKASLRREEQMDRCLEVMRDLVLALAERGA
jgi:hypothetical protein